MIEEILDIEKKKIFFKIKILVPIQLQNKSSL